jgi:hypothetical protein
MAVSTYVLVAITKKKLGIEASLYSFVQLLGMAVFEKTPISNLFENSESNMDPAEHANQLNLFNL